MSETLVSLNLSNTGVEDEGVKSVTEALTEYSTVEHLVIINTNLLYSSKQNTLTQWWINAPTIIQHWDKELGYLDSN